MRIQSFLMLASSIGKLAGGLVLGACGGDDDNNATPASDAGADVAVVDSGKSGTDAGSGDAGADAAIAFVPASNVLYVMSNDPTAGNNSVYGYHRGADGNLYAITGSPFRTGGTGIGNPMQALGPEDSDYQLITNPAHTKLFAVNGGSDTVGVFDIATDGSLTAIAGSQFASGGNAPVALALVGSNLLVTNQDRDLARPAQTGANANYATLAVSANGALSASGVNAQAAGSVPQLLLPTPDGTLAFGAELTFPATTSTPGLRSFTLGANGALTMGTGDVYTIPADGNLTNQFVLGLATNPNNKVLYVGLVGRSKVSAWTYDTTGVLTYKASVAVSGAAPCWIRVSKDGKYAYVTDTAFNQISVMSLSTDGLTMAEAQLFSLAGAGPSISGGGNAGHSASEAYDEEISPDGKFLCVISERLTNDATYTAGNNVHVLAISPTNGTRSEVSTVALDATIGNTSTAPARAEGLVVF